MQWTGRIAGAILWVLMCVLPAVALAAAAPDFGGERVAADVRQLAQAVLASGDHGSRPFAIVDKQEARLYVFNARGRLRGASAVLIGQAPGDDSAADVGDRAQTGYVPLPERTTPAGRFMSEPGRNSEGEPVVWVDYNAAFAIHRLRPGASRALREARLASSSPADRRVSWGCVVVPVKFYVDVVERLLGRSPGVVYVMPEQGASVALPANQRAADPSRLRLTATAAMR
jgi:hypothetical protein